MPKAQIPGKALFNFLDIHVSEIQQHKNAIQAMMFDRKFEGMIIREVFPRDTVDRVNQILEQEDAGIERILFPDPSEKDAYLLGQALISSNPDLQEYFAHAAAFRKQCRLLFQGKPDFETQIESVFQHLSGGLPVKIPTGPQGQTYASATIRVLPEGREIGIHVGNEFLHLVQANHLQTMVDLTDQISFFIPLSVPQAGGELVVYSLEYDDVAPFLPKDRHKNGGKTYRTGTKAFELVERYPSMTFTPGPGDMLIFDGGRYYHRVSPIIGKRPRRTIGGFLSLSREHDAVYYWS